MKKTLLTCLAVVALFAIASSASAITCTIDQRPAATLLVPYFQVSFDPDGNLVTTGTRRPRHDRDDRQRLFGADDRPRQRVRPVSDPRPRLQRRPDAASTSRRCACRTSSPATCPVTVGQLAASDVCQRNGGAVYPNPDGFLRVRRRPAERPGDRARTTSHGDDRLLGARSSASLGRPLRDQLRRATSSLLAIGYIVDRPRQLLQPVRPDRPELLLNDAIGMENNLFGEIIFTSGDGLPTYGISTVNLEADATLGDGHGRPGPTAAPRPHVLRPLLGSGSRDVDVCTNCGPGDPQHRPPALPLPGTIGFGDQREPLGLRWAAVGST